MPVNLLDWLGPTAVKKPPMEDPLAILLADRAAAQKAQEDELNARAAAAHQHADDFNAEHAGSNMHAFSPVTPDSLATQDADLAAQQAATIHEFDDKATQAELSDPTSRRSKEYAAEQARQRAELEAGIAQAKQAPVSAGALMLEREKGNQERQTESARQANVMHLLGGGGAGAGAAATGSSAAGAPGTWKPAINGKGEVSFQQNQMPALVQRAYNQLSSAHKQTADALGEAERLYPGITSEAQKVDTQGGAAGITGAGGRLLSTLTGIGAPKYGGPTDYAGAGLERFNYTLGVPTPFSKLAQEASFGNIEQMAGQLPGVRGLATITPLFKEHQSRWGHETPLMTVQRLMHMKDIMEQTLEDLRTGGGESADGKQ